MPNNYFQFKQFRIAQDQCAMKVSTDACLLGAVADLQGATRLLDIGTGTGLLALMAAQRHASVEIEAVELDEAAAAQAAANVADSPWAARIWVWPGALADFAAVELTQRTESQRRFSHIICNPPFFTRALPSAAEARSRARHASDTSLTFGELAEFASRFLLPDGALTLLLPAPELRQFQAEAVTRGLYQHTDVQVQHRSTGKITRHIACFKRGTPLAGVAVQQLIIQDTSGEYSADFRRLLSSFYLAL